MSRNLRAVVLLLAAAACSSDEPTVDPPACTGTPRPVGAADGEASRAWHVTATAGRVEVTAALGFESGSAVVVGTYRDGLTIGGHSLAGTGSFLARVSPDGDITRLAQLSTEPLTITSLAAKSDAIYAAVRTPDDVRIARIEADDTLSTLVSAGGTFDRDVRVELARDGVILSAMLGVGTVTIDGEPSLMVQYDPPNYPGHGVAVRLADDGSVTAWHIDGDAGSTLAVAGDYVTGRFGGFGRSEALFGPSAESPKLTAVSSDDDPAYDAFVAGRRGDGVSWAHRIRSYTVVTRPPPTAMLEGDLVVAIASDGYDLVFRDDELDAVSLGDVRHSLGRFAPDGTLRWARSSILIDQLWSVHCALYASATEPERSYLARFDGDGTVVGTRSVTSSFAFSQLALIGDGSWIVAKVDEDERLELARLDW